MELLSELLKTVILTNNLLNRDTNVVSLLLIAPPEHGKTSILVNEKCEYLLLLNDLTGSGLRNIAKQYTEASHIALLDMLMLTAHATKANRFLMANVATMTEEGFMGEAVPGKTEILKEPIRKGFICCMTSFMARDNRNFWNRSGITSRLLPFFYRYGESQTAAIHSSMKHDNKKKESKATADLRDWTVYKSKHLIDFNKKMEDQVHQLAAEKSKELGDEVDSRGFRRHKQFRSLACAHALLRAKQWKFPKVGAEDLKFLKRIYPYINYREAMEL